MRPYAMLSMLCYARRTTMLRSCPRSPAAGPSRRAVFTEHVDARPLAAALVAGAASILQDARGPTRRTRRGLRGGAPIRLLTDGCMLLLHSACLCV
jgi:hypothetical protein